jgi:hypothetical protein
MYISKFFTLPVRWLIALLLISSIVGCLGSSSSSGGGGVVAAITPPTVTSVLPASAATGIALNSIVIANFSKALDPLTVTPTTFTLAQGTTSVTGTVKLLGKVAAFYPAANLTSGLVYTATVTTGVKDVLGNALASEFSWSFTSSSAPDAAAPTVSSVTPLNNATGVALNASINATFSKAMDPISITPLTFILAASGVTPVPISGAVTYSGNTTTATLQPTSNLAVNTTYTATISTGVKDMQTNPLASNYTWSFMTGTAVAAGPAPVNLGTAGNFVILGETTITTTGTTAIVGDVGVSPAAATYLTGFSLIADASNVFAKSSLVTGNLYAANYAVPSPANMTTAVGDMYTAYVDAAGRSLPDYTELYAGDISGKTLVPGLYKWSTGVLMSTNITLSGGPNDVWIFQISGDLTVANGAQMSLAGGALPKNIFWQIGGGTGVTIGTTAHFEGIIMAAKAITLNTGATGNGRLLAQTAVTMISNTVTQPAP